ncbi:hypothetical protein F2Q70_00005040 [Brassica cretica]|uniref:DUF1985 domain-containing protein n=1 Tax=Brassica cretica TaxID=69181 RepID=A0A8S9IVJ2_BRACR|nr:hypothetical protein F2Q70_00005040 [Brassica cretica]
MDSTAPTSPPVDAVDDGSSTQLPRRMFALGFFPTGLRLNIYSKANVIGAVASALAGSADMDVLLGSQFGRLFHLPAARCHNSTKLVGSLLYHEFHSITGLNCGAFDVEDSNSEATVALVNGVLYCTNKTLKLTPKYVEMLTDVPSFLNYPWGRLSFLYILSRFLPPPVSKEIPDPLHELRIWLSQQTTACYGFPLALLLLAFEAVPQLLARIPDAGNTTTFLEDPSACANIVVILTTKDTVVVEAEPDVTEHFSLILEAERHLSGHTFTTEDFRGGEKSFCIRGKQHGNAPVPPEDKPEVVPIIQRNLRLRKPAAVVVEDLTSLNITNPRSLINQEVVQTNI